MNNPFIQMAMIAAALASTARLDATERNRDTAPDAKAFIGHRGARGLPGPRNPAGTKMIRKFYRNKHGYKADREDAVKWYSSFMAEK